jgi:hypothetical protein
LLTALICAWDIHLDAVAGFPHRRKLTQIDVLSLIGFIDLPRFKGWILTSRVVVSPTAHPREIQAFMISSSYSGVEIP